MWYIPKDVCACHLGDQLRGIHTLDRGYLVKAENSPIVSDVAIHEEDNLSRRRMLPQKAGGQFGRLRIHETEERKR